MENTLCNPYIQGHFTNMLSKNSIVYMNNDHSHNNYKQNDSHIIYSRISVVFSWNEIAVFAEIMTDYKAEVDNLNEDLLIGHPTVAFFSEVVLSHVILPPFRQEALSMLNNRLKFLLFSSTSVIVRFTASKPGNGSCTLSIVSPRDINSASPLGSITRRRPTS